MRQWSSIVTVFYIVVLALLVSPLVPIVFFGWGRNSEAIVWNLYAHWFAWSLLLAGGPLLLVHVTVTGPRPRPRPRRHIAVAALAAAGTLAVLLWAAVISIASVIGGDGALDYVGWATIFGTWAIPWLLWALVFWRMGDALLDPATRLHRRFVAGSVLELLIAVPSHVVTRVRGDCCAPAVTGWAIACGIAVLLMSLGPGALFLYRARMRRLRPPDHRPVV